MTPLQYIVEPEELLLTWQPADEASPSRTRRVVARIFKKTDEDTFSFEYLRDSEDFKLAVAAGFQGFPAYSIKHDGASEGVMETLLRRLPPRKREDFKDFLALHGLPFPFPYSDCALLGYTGARLPSDGFGVVPVFPRSSNEPCDLLIEVAGVRHTFNGDTASLRAGQPVSFEVDAENAVDPDAIRVLWSDLPLGYVNRALRRPLTEWLATRTVDARIWRVNGKPERPLVYVKLSVSSLGR